LNHYVQNVRIAKYCRILATTDKSVQQTANEVGYSDMKFPQPVPENYGQLSAAVPPPSGLGEGALKSGSRVRPESLLRNRQREYKMAKSDLSVR
jgi:hypothetical protein